MIDEIKLLKIIDELTFTRYNGRDRLLDVDRLKSRINNYFKKDCSVCNDCLDYDSCKSVAKGKKKYCKFKSVLK